MKYFKKEEYYKLPIDIDDKIDHKIDDVIKASGGKFRVIFENKDCEKLFKNKDMTLDFIGTNGFYNVNTKENIELHINKMFNSDKFCFTQEDLENGWVRYGVSIDYRKDLHAYITATKKEYAIRCARWLREKYSDKYIEYYDVDILDGPYSKPLDFKLDSDFHYIKDGLQESFHSMRRVSLMIKYGIMNPSDGYVSDPTEWI